MPRSLFDNTLVLRKDMRACSFISDSFISDSQHQICVMEWLDILENRKIVVWERGTGAGDEWESAELGGGGLRRESILTKYGFNSGTARIHTEEIPLYSDPDFMEVINFIRRKAIEVANSCRRAQSSAKLYSRCSIM